MSTITLPKVLANFETSLAASMSAAATTLTLKASVDGDAVTLSGVYALTLDEGTSVEEHMYVTLAGSAGTVTRRGLSKVDAWTEVSGNKFAHERGATVKITTFNVVLLERLLAGTDTFGAVDWTGVNSVSGLATAGAGEVTKAASVAYVNAVAIAGASDATTTTKGIVEEATQAEIAAGTGAGGTSARLFTNPSTLAPHIQAGTWLYALEDGSGSDDTYTASLTPALTAYTTGMCVLIKMTVANTAACTLNLNSLGAKNIKKYATGALADTETGDIVANQFCMFYYDGTQMVLINPGATMPTTALLSEMATFFGATDITGTEAETLSSGATGDASTLHTHNTLVTGQYITLMSANAAYVASASQPGTGFSDATVKIISIGGFDTTADDADQWGIEVSNDIGAALVIPASTEDATVSVNLYGILHIGAAVWQSEDTAQITKNGTAVSVVGTAPTSEAQLGHDPSLSYILCLDATNRVRRYSGIAGTTITLVDTITLDTAVTNFTDRTGFLFDATNNRYICIDSTNNLLRRFNSAGTTVDTAAYTVTDTNVRGLCFIKDRVYLVNLVTIDNASNDGLAVTFIPTTMTR